MDPAIIEALHSHAWPLIVWSVILLGIYVVKLPVCGALWDKVPKQYRPLVVAALGVAAAVGQAVITHKPWAGALIENLFAALSTIGADQVQSKLRG